MIEDALAKVQAEVANLTKVLQQIKAAQSVNDEHIRGIVQDELSKFEKRQLQERRFGATIPRETKA